MSLPCTHCGWESVERSYTLRFATDDGERAVELMLCEPCLQEITAEEGVSLVADDTPW